MRSAIVMDGRFRVFDDGRVFDIKNGVETPAKIYKFGEKKDYAHVRIRKDGKWSFIGVHRLVAIAFIPNPENKPLVNHKDGDTLWNCVNNLEWVTHSENTRHAYDMAIINPLRGAEPCVYCGFPTKCFGRICRNCEEHKVRQICHRIEKEKRAKKHRNSAAVTSAICEILDIKEGK